MSIKSGVMFIGLGIGLIACKPAVSGNLKSYDETEQEVDFLADQENGSVKPEADNSADLQLIQDSCYAKIRSSADDCSAKLEAAKARRTYYEYFSNDGRLPYGSTQSSFVGSSVENNTSHIGYTEPDNRPRLSEQEYLNRCIADAQEIYRCKFLSCMLQNVTGTQRQVFAADYDQRQCRRLF